MVGLGNVANTAPSGLPISTATQTALDLKAPLASPTFTGTVSGITATMVGLGNVANTSPSGLPISTATQTALHLKAPLASPTFTGAVNGITATMVGLGNVNNTGVSAMTLTQSQITGLTTILGTLQPKLNNLNNINNVFNSANALMTNFTPTDQIAWNTLLGTGSYTNTGATNVNTWGYTENNGQT